MHCLNHHSLKPILFIIMVLLPLTAFAKSTASKDLQQELDFLQAETQMIEVATKTAIPVNKAPGAVTVIDYAQIRKSGARTIPDLLRMVPGVNVRWNPMMQTIDMRGFGGLPFTSRVLLLIDGVPYNSWNKGGFPQQPGTDFFVLQNIRRLEVVRGPGSALYGENAYWGVINIVTLSGEDIEGGQVGVYGGGLKTEELTALYGKKMGDDGSILFSVKTGQTQMPVKLWKLNDSKVQYSNLFVKARYKDFTFSHYRYDDSFEGFKEPFAPPAPPTWVFKSVPKVKQTVNITALKYKHDTDDGNFSFGADVSRAQRTGMHCAACHDAIATNPRFGNFSKKQNHGSQWVGDLRMGVHSIPHNDLLFGIDVRVADAADHGNELKANTQQNYSKIAFYAQDIVSLLDDKLDIIIGGRYDEKTKPFVFKQSFSPRLAMVYNPKDDLTLRFGWSKAYRVPSFSELYLNSGFFNNGAFPLAVFQPSAAGLKPEQIQTYDLGATYQITSRLSSKLSMFYSEVDHFIVTAFGSPRPPAPVTVSFENHPARARIVGSELELKWELTKRWSGYVNWSLQNQKQLGNGVDSTGLPIEFVYAPKHKINVGVHFRPFTGFSGAFEGNWRSKVTAPSFWYGVAGLPVGSRFGDYVYLNLRLNYELPLFIQSSGDRPLKLTFNGRNLLNKKALETLTGQESSLTGQELYAGIEYSFN